MDPWGTRAAASLLQQQPPVDAGTQQTLPNARVRLQRRFRWMMAAEDAKKHIIMLEHAPASAALYIGLNAAIEQARRVFGFCLFADKILFLSSSRPGGNS